MKNFLSIVFSLMLVSYCQGQHDSISGHLPKDSTLLKEHFRVEYSEISNISSIDWDSWFDIYEITLQSDSFPPNTHIQFIMRRFLSPGVKSLISDIHRIKSTLIQSYPYKFSQKHQSASIEILYVNRNAISKEAKRNLKSERKRINAKYKIPNLKNAILITVLYNDTWQRWIVFENGESLLWHYRGATVLDLDPKLLDIGELYGSTESFKVITPDGKIETLLK